MNLLKQQMYSKNVIACPEQLEQNDLMMASYVFEQAGDKALAEQVRQESLKSVMAIQDVIPESAEEKQKKIQPHF